MSETNTEKSVDVFVEDVAGTGTCMRLGENCCNNF